MKRGWVLAVGVVALAGVAWLQVTPARRHSLAEGMPAGALVYLQAKDFGGLLREWQQSPTRTKWLASANYAAFAESNLFQKLAGVYAEYGRAATFEPGLAETVQMAGTESALALYDVRELQFCYLTKLPNAAATQSALWAARGKFEQRQSAGIPFFFRQDAESGKTVGFAVAGDWLIVATREDLLARALALQAALQAEGQAAPPAGATEPRLSDERWFADAAGAEPNEGDLRMILNLRALRENTYFRSYWVQRNVAEWKPFRAGVVDLQREAERWTEHRVFLREVDAPAVEISAGGRAAVTQLQALVPAEAGMYRATADPGAAELAAVLGEKLLFTYSGAAGARRFAPGAAAEANAGGEGEFETRIDAPPLPEQDDSAARNQALQEWLRTRHVEAALVVQRSELPAGSDFLSLPSTVVLESAQAWERADVQRMLSETLENRLSTGGLGLAWTDGDTASVEGLVPLHLAVRNRLLFLSTDEAILRAMTGAGAGSGKEDAGRTVDFRAGFRHGRERGNYLRLMNALDAGGKAARGQAPAFFSGNLGSLSEVFGFVSAVDVQRREAGDRTVERVTYQF